MKILALETSCEQGSIALVWDQRRWETALDGHAKHSEFILSGVIELLQKAELSIEQLDAIAFGAGPGAFTGMRLACGVAQGIGLAAAIPLVAVCSLEALALDAPQGPVLALTDARMGEVYCGAYRVHEAGVEQIQGPACMPPEEVVCPPGMGWWAIGSALAVYGQRLPKALVENLAGQLPAAVPLARNVAKLAEAAVAQGRVVDAARASPLYVRDKVALTTAERLQRGGRT